jgi:hypothetical protein
MDATMNKHFQRAQGRVPLLLAPTPPLRTVSHLIMTVLATGVLLLLLVSSASAGTYPMYQCSPNAEAVSPGWYVTAGADTKATTVLTNNCSNGGALGDYVSTEESAGLVTEAQHSGSQVALSLIAPGSAPDVTIRSISANVIASSVTGDDAFLGFTSAGQSLPGAVELPYGTGSNYVASDSWTLPEGARDFEAYVNCSTDRSSPTCDFADSVSVPALSNITLTLSESTRPAITAVSGALANAATAKGTITGSQTINFTATDADSGVRSAILTLSPQSGGAPYTHTFDFSGQCPYQSWNACPSSQVVSGFAVNTSSLKDDSYTVNLSVSDAAGNVASSALGTIVSHNAPANTSVPTILVPGEVLVDSTLTTHPGTWTAPSSAGAVTYAYQWEQCDTQGNSCQSIAGAQNASYTPTPADIGHTLRVIVSASDSDGSTPAVSAATSIVLSEQGTLGALPGPGTNTASKTPALIVVGVGTPNGTGASETATIRLGIRHGISRSFAHRALKIPGRLLDNQGHPINAAELDVLQQSTGGTTLRIIGHTQTRKDGTFLARIPAGPSRLVEIAYRAFSADTNYTTTGEVTESVSAAVQLRIAPRNTSSNGTIVLTGQVLGPVPSQGTIVDLLVHYRGQWEPFRTPQTDSHGHFEVIYQFEGGTGRFPFRATVPAGQAGFPFASGYSKVVNVTTG